MVMVPKIVIDTNVFISALRSRRGASFRLLSLIDADKFQNNLSVPLALEYEAVAKRTVSEIALTIEDLENIIDYIIRCSTHWKIHYLWRPGLKDPADDMLLELAVAAGCEAIITYNKNDFGGVERFGIRVVTPREFLQEIGEIS